LTAALFHKDDAGKMNEVTAGADANSGFLKRRHLTRNSRVLDLMGRLHADIFFQERYLLNNVDLKVRLTRSKDSFCLMSGNAVCTVKILGAQLLVRKARLSPSIALAHAKTLEVSNAKYPRAESSAKVSPFLAGSGTSTKKNCFPVSCQPGWF
jgi:hypothetical protein